MTLWAEENLSLATELMFSSIDCRDYNIEHIVIVPDRFSLLAEKKLLEKLPNHILFNVKVTNFSSFTTFLLEKLGRASELVSAGERILILQKAVNRVKDQFVYFKKSNINFCSQLFKAISLLESSRIFPSDIESEKFALSSTKNKFHDIMLVYQEYLSLLGDRLDPALLFEKLLQENDLEKILADKKIYLAQFDSFTSQMYEVIKLLALKSNELNASIAFSQSIGNGYIYESDIEKKFKAIAKENNIQIEVKVGRLEKSKSQKAILHNLFSCQLETSKESGAFKSIKAYSKRDEIEFVARGISALAKKGEKFSAFALALSDIQKYKADIEEVFGKFNIRHFIDYSQNAFDTVVTRALIGLFNVSIQNFSREAVIGFLINPLIARFENCHPMIEEILKKNLDGRWKYSRFFDFSSPLMRLVKNFDEAKTNAEMFAQVRCFLEAINVSREEFLAQLNEKGLYQEESIERQGYDQLLEAIDLIAKNSESGRCDKREFVKELELILSSKELSSVPSLVDAVMIGDCTDSFFEKRKFLFVLGGQDLPKVIGDNSILSDREIENPIYHKVVEPTSRMINRRNRFALFNLLSEGWQKIYISYLALGDDGKPAAEPSYIKQLNEIFEEKTLLIQKAFALKTDDDWANFFGAESNLEGFLLEKQEKNAQTLDKNPGRNKNLFFGKGYFSVTQLETFFSCPFKHFAKYGLKLSEKESFAFDARDSGNICHKAVELFVGQFLGKDFQEEYGMIESFLEQNFDKIIEEAGAKEKLELLSEQEGMKRFLAFQIKTILKNVCLEMQNSFFKPVLLEEKVESELGGLKFAGKIDRIDEAGDFFRIIDYKTGKPKSLLKDLYYGDKLQLFLYSLVAGQRLHKTCGGVFYFDCRFNYEESESGKAILKGLAENDDENLKQFDKNIFENGKSVILPLAISKTKNKTFTGRVIAKKPLSFYQQYALKIATKALDAIKEGFTEAKPDENSCRNCIYGALCGYRKEQGERIKKFSEKRFGD